MKAKKKCVHCGKFLPLKAFHRKRSARDGRQSWCKACYSARDYQRPEEPSGRRSPTFELPKELPDAFTLEAPNKAPIHLPDTHSRLSFYLRKDIHKRAKVACTIREISIETLIAQALDAYLPTILEQAKAMEGAQ